MAEAMRVAIGYLGPVTDERLRFAKQLGATSVLLKSPPLPGTERWEFLDLVQLRSKVEEYGLRLEGIENVPNMFFEAARLGLPGAERQIENYQETIRNLGRAGIPILGYSWNPNGVWRTSRTTVGRGGMLFSSFDLDLVEEAPPTHGRVFGEDEMWRNYERFITAVVPVAEEAGVRLALHPNDPPVKTLGGIARVFRSLESFKRGIDEIAPSSNHGLNFCVGTWSEMGKDVLVPLHHFGGEGKIFYIHLRDVRGAVPRFQECPLGEGNVDPIKVLQALKETGFDGFLIDDHVPQMIDDSEWGHRSHAFATGYIAGMLDAINHQG